ncbi:MAG: hypothetical protein LBQ50_14030 [Planctomycetaceae bacterium]|nr:hypothetical protein [Planctomycetaceae bacterium]
MSKVKKTTQRAYTLRLNGTDENDQTWRDHLLQTHLITNLGAKIFGDFLLTFCGGIDYNLAEQYAGKKEMGTLQDRRIILALSWLSVEDKAGAPEEKYHVKPEETETALRKILKERGLKQTEINSWCDDCRNSINAAIRDDAVWVNRSRMFDDLCKEWKLERNLCEMKYGIFSHVMWFNIKLSNRNNTFYLPLERRKNKRRRMAIIKKVKEPL